MENLFSSISTAFKAIGGSHSPFGFFDKKAKTQETTSFLNILIGE